MISNLMPFDWMTRLKLLWLRLIMSLNCSLNSGLLVFFTVLVLSLWASSYTRKRMHQNTAQFLQSSTDTVLCKSLTTLGKGNSNFTLASRSLGETPEGRGWASCEYTFKHFTAWIQDTFRCDFGTWGGRQIDASHDVENQLVRRQVWVDS